MLTTAQLTYEKLRFDEAKDLHLVVTLTAPRTAWQAKRPRICVLPVVDVSGSMEGAKLHYAKQSVLKLVDHLAPGDLCGVVTFSDEVASRSRPRPRTSWRSGSARTTRGRRRPPRRRPRSSCARRGRWRGSARNAGEPAVRAP